MLAGPGRVGLGRGGTDMARLGQARPGPAQCVHYFRMSTAFRLPDVGVLAVPNFRPILALRPCHTLTNSIKRLPDLRNNFQFPNMLKNVQLSNGK